MACCAADLAGLRLLCDVAEFHGRLCASQNPVRDFYLLLLQRNTDALLLPTHRLSAEDDVENDPRG